MRYLIWLLPALTLGCAVLTEEQCQSGDWEAIGMFDGQNGRMPAYLERHEDTCRKYGITPDLEEWERGRQRGLTLYCTPTKAYEEGRRGASLTPVCPETARAQMQPAYLHGRRYFEIERELDQLDWEFEDLLDDLEDSHDRSLTSAMFVRFRLNDIRDRQRELLRQQALYASWPPP